MKLIWTLCTLFLTVSSYAQSSYEDSYEQSGEISAPAPKNNYGTPTFFKFHAIFDSFRSQSFRKSGIEYGAELGIETLNEFSIYAGAPMIYGQIQNKNVSELGNPYVGGELLFFESGAVQSWGKIENRFTRPEAEIAAHNNTLIPGIEFRYDQMKTVSNLGADYYWRYGERDSSVDIKDVVSLHASVGRKLTRRLTLSAQVLWYRAFGVTKDDLVLARQSDWAGAGPVAKIYLGGGAVLKSSLLFPVQQSRSQQETEVAVWNANLPKVSEVTWKTDVGVQF